MEKYVLILCTTPNIEEARELIKGLLSKNLVACASIIPGIESWFIWEGKVEKAQEVKIFLKTKLKRFSDVEEFILSRHSYKVPEILQISIDCGFEEYLNWIENSVQ